MKKLGIVVGRFQVPNLTEGHLHLLREASKASDRVIVFLGTSRVQLTRSNPLDFEMRKTMVIEQFPKDKYNLISVEEIKDVGDNNKWSANLDAKIREWLDGAAFSDDKHSVTLFGSRDSFIPSYTTKTFKTQAVESPIVISGTEIRNKISEATKDTSDFREGVIWAAFGRRPTTYPTVDIAIINRDKGLLLGRKPDQDKFRFIGGFAEPDSESYEADAIREVKEETGLTIDIATYVGSLKIDDWRYRRETDKIKTLFFIATRPRGIAVPNDDIAELKWIPFEKLHLANLEDIFFPDHVVLARKFMPDILRTMRSR